MTRKLNLPLSVLCFILLFVFYVQADSYLESLKPEQKVHGFTVLNLYDNSADQAMGARFISDKYGFIIDLMQIQSVPQAFYWVKTPPSSSKGEAHACEHLLLGKGNRGRYVAALEDMALGNSSAWTAQTRTVYHFNTTAGEKTFYDIFEAKLQALLHPDFTDEEIRREVCHIGININPDDSSLALEEKGTVYTEMVSAFEKPWYHVFKPMNNMVYGKSHPLALVSGGDPNVMRSMVPEDMWKFHRETYHLSNMGVIVAIPDNIPIDTFMAKMAEILNRCQDYPDSSSLVGIGAFSLPPTDPAPYGAMEINNYPSERPEDPGYMIYAWPAYLELNYTDRAMLSLFLQTFASGETSTLYDLFINSETRKINIGGNYVFGDIDFYFGNCVYIGLVGVDNQYINETMVDSARSMVIAELKRIHGLADGSEELGDFNGEAESHLLNYEKQVEDYLNSPPMFGFRSGAAGGWLANLEALEKVSGFRKSLVFKNEITYAKKQLASNKNFWKGVIEKCRLLDVKPYAIGSRPSPEIVKTMSEEKNARLAGYVNDFKKKYKVNDEQAAIAGYKDKFDKKTAELEKAAAEQELPGFIDNPPLTLDDQLKYETIMLPGNIPLVASTFENMKSSTIAIAFRLDAVPESLLVYVPFLPDVLTSIGVIENGQAIAYDLMQERLRKELLRMHAQFDFGYQTGRIELVLTGAGSNLDELKNALSWMSLGLYSPYLDVKNLSRMTDVVDQTLISLRNTMKSNEENWVSYPAYAYRYQTNPLFMSTNNFLTRIHHFHRLRFMLADPGSKKDQQELAGFIESLAMYGQSKNREQLMELLTVITEDESTTRITDFKPLPSDLPEQAKTNALLAAKALKNSLADIPDANLIADWAYLCREIEADIMIKPADAIAGIKKVLASISKADNARMVIISSSADRQAALNQIKAFAAKLDSKSKTVRQNYAARERITERLKSREPGIGKPLYVGLVHEGTRNGVIINSARYAEECDTSAGSVARLLAGKLYSGSGAHGLFMRTWGAGLAYSNGFSINEINGRVGYYAERCPDVAETMRFVVNELKSAKYDPKLKDYAIAQVFGRSRAASRYETRGTAMAADLVDGYPPERIAAFRSKILKMKSADKLYDKLVNVMPDAYGDVLIGYGKPLSESRDGYFFLIGPETQFESWENYIASVEGKQTVYRLYPRDFWLTM